MEVKFENGSVPIYKVRQGALVRFNHDYYYVKFFQLTPDGRFEVFLENADEDLAVNPRHVEWLEPM